MNDPIRILLVDDSPHFLDALCGFLEYQASISVAGMATGGEEALAQAQALQPDAILLDLNLGDISGLTLLPLFRERAPAAKIIVLTMMEEGSYRAAAMQAGADGFVHKSVMSTALVAAILEAMQPDAPAITPMHGNTTAARVPRPTVDFQRLAEHLPDLVYRYELTPARGFSYVSPSATAMTGYTPEEHYADPDLGFRLVHADDRPLLEEVVRGDIEPLKPVELRWVRKDGAILWTEQLNVKVHNEAGEVVAIEGMARDITGRKAAEQTVAASEARYRELFEANPHAMWVYDLATLRFLAVNDTAVFRYGYSRDEFLTMSLADIRPAEEIPNLMRNVASDSATVQNSGGWKHRLKDGRLIDVEITSHALQFEGRAARLVLASDITERRRAEAALHASEERFRVTFEQAAVGIAHVAPSGRWLRVNQRLCEITGYTRDELLSRSFQEITHPDDLDVDLEHVRQMLAGEIQTYSLEKRYIRKEGSIVWILLTVSLLRDDEGAPEYFISVVQDISERKQSEEALRQSEVRYRALFEQSNDAVFILDLQGNLMQANRRASEMLGYAPEELVALSYVQMSATMVPSEEVLAQLLMGMRLPTYESQFRRKHGEVFPVEVNVELVRDEGGNPLHIQSVVRDITERKQAAAALHLQASALEVAANAIVITDASGTIEWVNSAWTRLTGYAMAEAIGKNPRILASGRQGQAFYKNLWETILAGTAWHGELTNRRRDGSLYEEEQTITPIADPTGKITHFIGIKQDITERKQAEEQIRRQVERLAGLRAIDQTILSNVDLQVNLNFLLAQTVELLAVDAAAILLVNAAQNVLEFEAGCGFHMEAMHLTRVPLGDSSAWAMDGATMRMARLTGDGEGALLGPVLSDEGFVSHANVPLNVKGRRVGVMEVYSRTAQEHDAAWFDFLGTLAGQAAIAVENARLAASAQRELAERRRAEAELRTLNQELEERVEARTAELTRLNLELERALHIKDEFLANMSHELRTPLTVIISLSEVLEMQIAGPLNEKQRQYVTTVGESGAHLLALINDILDIAKSEAGQLKLSYDIVDVQATCEAARRMVIQLVQQKEQRLLLEIDESLGQIRADGRRLKQMLVNLLSNAVKFTAQSGSIGLAVRGNHERHEIAFTVWDTGTGIPAEDLPKLFRPFVQLDSHETRTATGTGLGLALVAQMARLHGGSVEVESEVGIGSRFTITLPWAPPQAEEVPPGAGDPAEPGAANPVIATRTGTILLVEDSESIVTALSEYLEHVGYRVAVARNGVEGIAQARQVRPDLILMDVRMAELDGLETTRRLRREPGFLTTPIIALTAHAMESDRAQCLAAGMNDYLSKPVDLPVLLRTIERFLAG